MVSVMKSFFEIIKNEFITFKNDKGMILVMVIGVICYSLFYSIPYSKEVIKEVPIGIVDFDATNTSKEFIRNLNTTDYVKIVKKYSSKSEVEKDFYKNKISGFAIIPKDFQKDIYQNKQAKIAVYIDSSYMIIYKAVYAGVMQTALETGTEIEVKRLTKAGMTKQTAKAISQPFIFAQVPLYNPAGGYETYIYPVILIVILHQTLIVALGMLQGTRNEKRSRYCTRDKEIPITLLARATFYVLLYTLYGMFIFLICPALCKYPMSYNILPLIVLYLLMLYSCVFFTQVISYTFRTRESSLMILVVTSLIFIFLPGLIWAKESIPQIINVASLFIPATKAIEGITKINIQGATLWQVRGEIVWLIFLTLFYYIAANFVTKKLHKEYKKDYDSKSDSSVIS